MRLFCALVLLCSILPVEGQQFRLLRPVPDSIQTNGSYLFGEPHISNPSISHRGIDMLVRYDTVYSASAGRVSFVGYNPHDTTGGYEPSGCGNYIMIESTWDGSDIFLLYCHFTKPLVGIFQEVEAGQPIGISGNTGFSTGPHLHFEIRMHTPDFSAVRSRRNPELWVAINGMGAIYGTIPNAPNSTRVDISPDPKPRPPYSTFGWALTYNFNDLRIGSDEIYAENYAIGDIKPGTYTITAMNGLYRRVVTVGAGEVVNADPPTSITGPLTAERNEALYQNSPNPFNPVTLISFYLHRDSDVDLRVYDLLGREIQVLLDDRKLPGEHRLFFTAENLASGVYIYSLIAKSVDGRSVFRESKVMILTR